MASFFLHFRFSLVSFSRSRKTPRRQHSSDFSIKRIAQHLLSARKHAPLPQPIVRRARARSPFVFVFEKKKKKKKRIIFSSSKNFTLSISLACWCLAVHGKMTKSEHHAALRSGKKVSVSQKKIYITKKRLFWSSRKPLSSSVTHFLFFCNSLS